MNRYARQSVFQPIGEEGQKKLLQAKVVILGMGALGTAAANNLCRAGIGHIRMVDRDYVELTNLQRQILFNEEDARQALPKVIAAANHLGEVNSEIELEPIIGDINSTNVETFIEDMDVVLDATDNLETRLLINEACHKHHIPWIYCAALGSEGMTLTVLPDQTNPCLRCFIGEANSSGKSCSTFGVLNMITVTMASIQTAEAMKLLLDPESVRKGLLAVDLWKSQFNQIPLVKNPDCPVCVHGIYTRLNKIGGAYTTTLCGDDSVQVMPPISKDVNLKKLAQKLEKIGTVLLTPYSLKFSDNLYEIILFQDGRAIIKNVTDAKQAKSVYTEYLN